MTDNRRLLELALKALQAERAPIDAEIADVTSQLRGRRRAASTGRGIKATAKPGKKPRMTASQRKAISERMKKYWAKKRKGK